MIWKRPLRAGTVRAAVFSRLLTIFSEGQGAAHASSSTRINLRYIREKRAPTRSRTMHMAVP